MKIYNYKQDTNEFLGESMARPNPLEPGNYLIPRNATTVAPKTKPGKNEVLVFENNNWVIKEDYRGTVVYNAEFREGKTIDEIGPFPKGFILDAPTSEYDEFIKGAWVKNEAKELQDYRENLECGPLQIRRAIRQFGYKQAIEDWLAKADEDTREDWQVATVIKRLDPMVLQVQKVLGATDEQVDNLFELGKTLA